MKTITKGKMWCFAIGQFGWSLLSALITNWLVYFYQPDADSIAAGQTLFIPQGRVILGIATVIGGIAALGRVFDAVTDPMIANLSDRSTNPKGRRIPFMQKIAIPFALITALVFWAPVNAVSGVNCIWLLVTLLLFYLFMTTYCTPYNALISELGTTQDTRISISTYISVTFILGSAIGYAAPFIWGALEPSMGRVTAIRITFAILSVIGLIALLVPTFTINEKEYVHTVPSNDDAFTSLIKTFKNHDFRIFVGSDVLYFLGLTIFQTGLPFFITSLMKLPETFTTCYMPVNALAHRMNKKRLVLIGFTGLSIVYLITAVSGLLGGSGLVFGIIIVCAAAFPMAILGILPQAIVADIAEADAVVTGENREGMFFAARTFAFKFGQSIAMLVFTAFASIGTETGGALILSRYNEEKILGIIVPEKK